MSNELSEIKSQQGIVDYANQYVKDNNIILSKKYNFPVAMNNMWLTLLASNEKNKCLEQCSPLSIKQAVQYCINNELDTGRTQGYFVPFGSKLEFMPSYFGVAKIARDVANVNIVGQVIYDGEAIDIKQRVDGVYIIKHKPDFKCFNKTIVGAYAIATDVTTGRVVNTDIMTSQDIETSLSMSKTGGAVAKKYKHEMYIRTVIKRLAKKIINTSDDKLKLTITDVDGSVMDISNTQEVYNFDEYSINTDEQIAEEQQEYEPTENDIVTADDLKIEDVQQQQTVDIPENAVTVPYSVYKNNKEDYQLVKGSYNPATKTCSVIKIGE